MAVFPTCAVETEIFLLMRVNIDSYRGDFQFPYTLAFCLLWDVGESGDFCLLLVFRLFAQKRFPVLYFSTLPPEYVPLLHGM